MQLFSGYNCQDHLYEQGSWPHLIVDTLNACWESVASVLKSGVTADLICDVGMYTAFTPIYIGQFCIWESYLIAGCFFLIANFCTFVRKRCWPCVEIIRKSVGLMLGFVGMWSLTHCRL